MAVVDSAAPGEAPASSAAAGLLDPLSVKGRLMWQGEGEGEGEGAGAGAGAAHRVLAEPEPHLLPLAQ